MHLTMFASCNEITGNIELSRDEIQVFAIINVLQRNRMCHAVVKVNHTQESEALSKK